MTIITRKPELQELCEKIDASGRFALDLEFIPERTYEAELCLVQVATDDGACIIDPQALPDLMPLWERIASPDILKVLHAADQDLELAFNASGLIPQNIMDTQIMAGFLGFGYPVGYGKLLQQTVGITISKTESYTDWTIRPLTKSQIEYALDDVAHLLPIYDRLVEKLESLGRRSWVQEECQRYCETRWYEKDRTNDFFRLKGANTLNRRSLAVLRELTDWRRGEAARTNRPLRSILQDGILLEFARHPPKQMSDLQRIRGFRNDQARQYGNGLLQAIQSGMEVADEDLPKWPSAKIPTKREILTADVLYTVLRVLCFELDIAPELVATRNVLEALVRRHSDEEVAESRLPILKGWRYEIAGSKLVDLLNGADVTMKFQEEGAPVHMNFQSKAGKK